MDDARMKTKLLLTAALCFLAPAVISAYKDAVDVDHARTTLKKWVETRRIISQEKRDWALTREVLNGRIDLVQREIDAQRGKIGETEASIAAVDHQRADLIEAKTAQGSLRGAQRHVNRTGSAYHGAVAAVAGGDPRTRQTAEPAHSEETDR
jgi:hypothetical protein